MKTCVVCLKICCSLIYQAKFTDRHFYILIKTYNLYFESLDFTLND